MEVGFHEEPHFAIMTELGRLSHHGDSGGIIGDKKWLPRYS